ncbi:MAG: hypothetical protein ABI323_14415 [Solirubrobacteraceae bacterium]
MHTFRRLNDPERYYGLSWRGWLAAGAGGGLLYLAVRLSPFGLRPTITIVVLALAFVGVILHGLSGQAIGPERYLAVMVRYRLASKTLTVPERPDKLGLVLDAAPEPSAEPDTSQPKWLAAVEELQP